VNQPSTEDKTCNAEENGIDMPENRSWYWNAKQYRLKEIALAIEPTEWTK
jgi:hypothetical protein